MRLVFETPNFCSGQGGSSSPAKPAGGCATLISPRSAPISPAAVTLAAARIYRALRAPTGHPWRVGTPQLSNHQKEKSMRRRRDPELNPSALNSGPDVESYRRAGRQAGEEDRQAKIVAEGGEMHVEQVRRTHQRYRSEHEFAGGHVADGYNELIAEAQAAHEE